MDDESIQEVMRELLDDDEIELCQEEYQDDSEPSVDICDAPPSATTPDLTLTENGLVDEESMITAFTMGQLEAEMERRRTKDSDTIVG